MHPSIRERIETAAIRHAQTQDRDRVRDMLTDAERTLNRTRTDDRDAYITAAQAVAGLRAALEHLEHRARQHDPTHNVP
jgi:hypothetical protein